MSKKKNNKRADGRLETTVTIGHDENGKPLRKHLYAKSAKELNEKVVSIKMSIGKGLDISAQNDTFKTWADIWLKLKKPNIGNSQYKHYLSYLKCLNGYIGEVSIKDIRLIHIQEIINSLFEENPNTGKHSSKKLLTEIKNTAKQVFEFAIDNKVIDYNPAAKVQIPKKAISEERRALTEEEQAWISETPHRMQTASMIMMYAGLRRGELIPLTWDDIDLKRKKLSVNKAVDLTNNKAELKATKTKAGNREVDIPDILADYLKTIEKTSDLVCPSSSGNMHTATSWRSAWDSYLLDLNLKYGKEKGRKSKYDPRFKGITIEKITPHMLRHTYCTNLILAGVTPTTVQQQMGHANIQITLDIYTHITSEFKENDMQKYNNFLKKVVKSRQDNTQIA